MKRVLIAMTLIASFGAFAQTTTTPPCPAGTITCNNSTQHMGDTTQTASADNDQSVTNQAGNHANSIASGVNINPSIQQSGNAVTQNGNSVQGGNASAVGNSSSNNSSASTGASSANNTGMNGLGGTATIGPVSTGASTATVGPTSNSLTGGETTNKITGGSNEATGGSARQRQALDSTNTVSGAAQSRSVAENTGGNSTTAVDASDRSTHSSRDSLTILPMQPSVPMSISPATSVAVIADPDCGPYQEVIRTPVYGYFFGIASTSRKVLDHDDTLAPPSRYDDESTMGVKAIYTVSTVNLAGARSISLGGGGSSGGWGQGNTGTTSSMTAQVTHIQLRACRLVQAQQRVVVIHDAPQVERPVLVPHRRAIKKLPYCPPVAKGE